MSTQIIVAFSIIFIAHKLVLWLTGRSQVLRDVPGPEKEHWLKGVYYPYFLMYKPLHPEPHQRKLPSYIQQDWMGL